MYKTIGILGGMGPAATCDLMQKIIARTVAANDREHIPQLVDCNTAIPDRTAALLHGGEDPVPQMLKSARRLQAMGADFLIMPCNTAHCFLPRLKPEINIPFVEMPKETVAYAAARGVKTAGLLATTGTVRSGLYAEAFAAAGIKTVVPSEKNQALVMDMIYNCVKAGKPCRPEAAEKILAELRALGAEKFILACTELPLAFAELGLLNNDCIDPSAVLARAAVLAAGAPLKEI